MAENNFETQRRAMVKDGSLDYVSCPKFIGGNPNPQGARVWRRGF